MTPTSPRTAARRDIQGLRALAVVAVVLAHVIGWPRGGFVGVDVFFVISGFLITALLLRELAATGRISLRDFFARRIRRIAPAAVVVLLAVVAAAFAVFSHVRAEQTLWDAVASLALVANWRFAAQGTDYFTMGDAVSPLQHFWSLSVEEQFYLVWPALILLAVLLVPLARRRRAAPLVVGLLAVVAIALSAGWAMLQTPVEPAVAYFSTATRAWELAVGALLAVGVPLLARLPAVVRGVLGWTGAAVVVASFFVIDPALPFPAPWAALPVAGAALVIAGGIGGDLRQRHLFPLTNPLAVFLGDISYSLYLWHFPVLVFAGMLLPAGDAATAIVFGAIVVLSLASYFGVEQPLHRSPWLRRRAGDGSAAEHAASPVTVAAPVLPAAPAPAARVGSRPEGWVPGRRYFPGSASATQQPGARVEPQPVEEAQRPSEAVVPERLDVSRTAVDPLAERPWARWRARFGVQIGFAGAGLVLGAGL